MKFETLTKSSLDCLKDVRRADMARPRELGQLDIIDFVANCVASNYIGGYGECGPNAQGIDAYAPAQHVQVWL